MSDELDAHLAASRRRGRFTAIGLVVLMAGYLIAAWVSGWSLGAVIAGGVVYLVVVALALRGRAADSQETDRLLDEQIRDAFGGEDV